MIPVQYITTPTDRYDIEAAAKKALKGDCRWIRLRFSETERQEEEQVALRLQQLCRKHQATFILEDRPELAEKIQADGVHLTDNTQAAAVRKAIGEAFLIGTHAHTTEEVQTLRRAGVDYLDFGPYGTGSGHLSLDDYRAAVQALYELDIPTPLCAFGEITPDTLPSIGATGVRAVVTTDLVFFEKDFWSRLLRFS